MRVLIFLVFAAIWIITVSPGWANVFEVKGVPVDVTAENAAQARTEALVRGQHEAFRRLLERLILAKDIKNLPEIGTMDITEFVSDFAVSDEKTSSVRYLAKLNVRFKPEPVRRLLGTLGIRFAETKSKPLLVLPLLQEAHKVQLWEENNIWRKVWNLKSNRNGLVKIILPNADELDMSALDVASVLDGNVELLSGFASRYGAGDTLVSYMRFGLILKSGYRRLKIANIRYSFMQKPITNSIIVDLKPGESKEVAMMRGADAVIQKLEEEWKFENLLRNNGQGVGTFTVPISGLKDWLDVKQRIRAVSVVRRMELILVSLDEVRINLHYVGALEQLRTALRQADLTMIQEESEWVLYTTGVVQPGKL